MTSEACIVEAVRTPIGRHGGALSTVRPDDLAAHVLRGLLDRTGVAAGDVDEVVLGCANQAGEDNRNVARMASLLAGYPDEVPGTTVNRLCGSGMEAVIQAARAVQLGDADIVVAGGVESMSRAPWVVPKTERGFATGPLAVADTTLGWRLVNRRMEELGHTDALGITAETVAHEDGISRADQDRFAVGSHRKALAARERLAEEILPVTVPVRRGDPHVVDVDEGPRGDTSVESLERLRPAFAVEGTVTAGNASSLNDGAAAVLVVSRQVAQERDLPVLATVRGSAAAGLAPRVMGLGPVPATEKVLGRLGIGVADLDLIEVNEAFAAQSVAVLRRWGLEDDDERVNVNGGAIALGHPLGASGARLVGTLARELARRPQARLGLASMCIGVGQGISVVLERDGGRA